MARNRVHKTRGTSSKQCECEDCGSELSCPNCDSDEVSRQIHKMNEVYYNCSKCGKAFLCRCQKVKGLFI
jgi:predicted RNA-binding Zn-ribbon protein involved in translation (DUF1610 family)